jgi:hypothetical protein
VVGLRVPGEGRSSVRFVVDPKALVLHLEPDA